MLRPESNSVRQKASPFQFRKINGQWQRKDTRHKRPRWKDVVYPKGEE